MSQFILFTTERQNKLFLNLEKNLFLQRYARIFFQPDVVDNICTIPEFDKLCTSAQEDINNGINIYNTELFKVLDKIKEEEIYFWYGSEYNDLEEINDFNELISNIKDALIESSGEIYIHYKT